MENSKLQELIRCRQPKDMPVFTINDFDVIAPFIHAIIQTYKLLYKNNLI